MANAFSMSTLFLLLSFVAVTVFCGMIVPTIDHQYVYRTWPNLRGKPVDEVATKILSDNPRLKIVVRFQRDGITSDILVNNVFLYEDENGIVVNVPETMEETYVGPAEVPNPLSSDVIGMEINNAIGVILNQNPDAKIEIVHETVGSTTDEEGPQWVRLVIDADQRVVDTQRKGSL